jgi:hypothetical protein
MPDTIKTQNGFRVYVSFSFSLSLFLMWAGSHWGKVLFGPRLQLVHIQKPDHPPSISHESHPKLDPHTHHINALFQQRTKKREKQSHICSWRFIKQHFCKAFFYFVYLLACLLARLLVFFYFKLTLLRSVSPLFTQNTPHGVTIKSGSNLSRISLQWQPHLSSHQKELGSTVSTTHTLVANRARKKLWLLHWVGFRLTLKSWQCFSVID